jgi:hypothetical protein
MIVEPKSVTPAFDHLISEGWTFGDLTVFSVFSSSKVCLFGYLGHYCFSVHVTFFTFYLDIFS